MTVPIRLWVVDNSGSMLLKDLVPGQGAKEHDHSRWEEVSTMLSFFAEFVEALGARTDIHFLNQPGATGSGLLNFEEFQALYGHFSGGGATDPQVRKAFERYDVNASKQLSAAELRRETDRQVESDLEIDLVLWSRHGILQSPDRGGGDVHIALFWLFLSDLFHLSEERVELFLA